MPEIPYLQQQKVVKAKRKWTVLLSKTDYCCKPLLLCDSYATTGFSPRITVAIFLFLSCFTLQGK